MKQVTVTIGSVLTPDPIQINSGDIVIWVNNTAAVQSVNSDSGQTFTTGTIQPSATSLPITVPGTTTYTVTPINLHGTVNVAGSVGLPRT